MGGERVDKCPLCPFEHRKKVSKMSKFVHPRGRGGKNGQNLVHMVIDVKVCMYFYQSQKFFPVLNQPHVRQVINELIKTCKCLLRYYNEKIASETCTLICEKASILVTLCDFSQHILMQTCTRRENMSLFIKQKVGFLS